ncbi:MAG: tryptophan--tRNA ligase [Alphaproteobacteria bacterium]|nr:tryptophan--tRNA ligase [Alphaproteobacteria bacterium]
MSAIKKRIFSGVQPTGNLHLGNYLGAIRNWVKLQDEYECIFCVVDMHAITLWQDPKELLHNTREVAAGMIASGIDPEKNILFNQSKVSAHAELAWICNCVARMGWLNRMTQFKEKAGKNKEKVSVGLYAYPNLMAADILAYKATHVPVGEDQKQHLELTRDVAQKFNNDFGKEVFPLVEPLIFGEGTRIMSLRDGSKKMSKSDPSDYSRINMTDDADTIAKKIRKAKTDPLPLPENKEGLEERPEAKNLIGIYATLSDKTIEEVLSEIGEKPFSEFKADLTDLAVSLLAPINDEMNRLMNNTDHIDAILAKGGEKATALAAPVIAEVYETVGFLR